MKRSVQNILMNSYRFKEIGMFWIFLKLWILINRGFSIITSQSQIILVFSKDIISNKIIQRNKPYFNQKELLYE